MALTNGLRYCSVLLLTGMLFGCDNGDFYFKVKESQMHRDYISKHYMDEDEGYELKEVPEDFFRELPVDYDITLYAKNGKLVHNKIWESEGSESKVIIPIKYGKAHGKCLSFNWNKNEYDFNNNNYTGDYKIKLTLASEYTYRLGKLHGKYKEYYDDGQIKLEGEYNHGKQIGKEIFYSEGGRVLSSIEYVSGKMKDAKTYFENGRLKKHSKYHDNYEIGYQQYNSAGKLIMECEEDMSHEIHYKLYDPKTKRYRKVNWTRDGVFDDLFFYYNKEGEFVCSIKSAIKPGDREIIEFSNRTVLSFIPTQGYDTEAKDPMLELPRGKYTYRLSTQEIQCFENRRLVGTYNLKSKQVNGTIQLAGLLKPITSWQTLYGNHQESGLWDYCKEINEIQRIKQQAGFNIYFESLEEFSKKIPKAVY
jgi:antitoxin component YwqK of YwqJK toxin-antitoxin module